ncbi:hypothetical protein WMY93_000502 [Mugilogobius chulae]|uniref:Helitron helicase-like domain-containing protein n=1 Tax=Mugilogobius chulae TaxID=88201 RepID=A0AAW0Q585_9GOBI
MASPKLVEGTGWRPFAPVWKKSPFSDKQLKIRVPRESRGKELVLLVGDSHLRAFVERHVDIRADGPYSFGFICSPGGTARSLEIDVRNAAVNRRVSKCVLLATGNDTCSRGQTLKKAQGDFHELLKTVTRLCPKTCVVDFPPRHNHVSVAKQNRFRRAYQVETELAKLEYVSCVEEFPMNNLRLWAHDATHLSHPDGMQVLTDLICKAIRILSMVEPAPPAQRDLPCLFRPLRGLLMWLSSVAHRKLSAPSLVLQRQTQKISHQEVAITREVAVPKVRGLSPIPVSSGQFDVLAAPQKTPKNPASLARSKVTQPGAVVPRQPKRPRRSAARVEEATSPTSSWQPRVLLKTEVAVPSRPAVNTVTTQPQDQPMQTDDVPVSPTAPVCKEAKVALQPVEPTVKRTSIAATADHTAVKAKAVAVTPRPTEVKSDVAVMTSNKFAEKTTTWADKVKSPPTSTCAKVPLTSDWNPYIVVKKTGSTIQQNQQVQSDMTMMTSGAGASKTNATSKTEKVPVKRASCGTSTPVVKLQRLSHEDCKGKAPEAPSAAKQAPVVQLQRLQNDDSGAKFTHLENIVGSFHQAEALFSARSRGRQCTANALAAIVRHTHVRNVLEWSQEDLNKVLQEDSHARSKSGMVDGGGKSVVVFLKSLSEVHDHINQLAAGFGAGNAEFELSSVAVSLKDHKSECKDVSVEVVTVGSESECESDKEGKQVCLEVVTVDSESDCESLREEEHVVVTMESEFESESEHAADVVVIESDNECNIECVSVSAEVVAMETGNENKIEHVSDGVTFVGSANETECERMTEMMDVDTFSDEVQQVVQQVSVASRKGHSNSTGQKETDNVDSLEDIVRTDDGYRFLRPIRGTPAYWEDLRWGGLLNTVLKQEGRTETVESLEYEERCALLRNNPVTAARIFDYRWHLFLNKVLLSPLQPLGKINDVWFRTEFAQRGSPHVHLFTWQESSPVIGKNTDEEVTQFIDKYISCKIPTNDQHLADIVTTVQKHSERHSKTCRKRIQFVVSTSHGQYQNAPLSPGERRSQNAQSVKAKKKTLSVFVLNMNKIYERGEGNGHTCSC